MFRRKKRSTAPPYDEAQARTALERLADLTDRLEDTTEALAALVAEMQRQEADHV